MNYYLITVKHDGGRFRIRVCASSLDAAIRMLMASEGCQRGAIVHAEPSRT